jgi:hypothetical protein
MSIFEKTGDDFCDNRSEIVLKDKRASSKYVGLNPNNKLHICRHRIDSVIIKDGSKCDYLLLNMANSKAYFVELKGHDVNQAAKQIRTAIEILEPKLKQFIIYARIVTTRINNTDIRGSDYQKLQKQVQNRLVVKNVQMKENLQTNIIS